MLELETSAGQLTGEWVGTYHTGPVGHAEVHLAFFQLDQKSLEKSARGRHAAGLLPPESEVVVGIFQTTTGAIGTMELRIDGNEFQGTSSQVTPGCTTSYQMSGTVDGKTMRWSFKGQDCLGSEDGSGEAHRVWPESAD